MSFAQKSRRETVKTRYTVTLAMTASFVLGALAAQTLELSLNLGDERGQAAAA